jgi:hypothetical protein
MTNEIYVKPNNKEEAEVLLRILDRVGWLWRGDEYLTEFTNYDYDTVYRLYNGSVSTDEYDKTMNITPIQTALFETDILKNFLPFRLIKLLNLECKWEELLWSYTDDRIVNYIETLTLGVDIK